MDATTRRLKSQARQKQFYGVTVLAPPTMVEAPETELDILTTQGQVLREFSDLLLNRGFTATGFAIVKDRLQPATAEKPTSLVHNGQLTFACARDQVQAEGIFGIAMIGNPKMKIDLGRTTLVHVDEIALAELIQNDRELEEADETAGEGHTEVDWLPFFQALDNQMTVAALKDKLRIKSNEDTATEKLKLCGAKPVRRWEGSRDQELIPYLPLLNVGYDRLVQYLMDTGEKNENWMEYCVNRFSKGMPIRMKALDAPMVLCGITEEENRKVLSFALGRDTDDAYEVRIDVSNAAVLGVKLGDTVLPGTTIGMDGPPVDAEDFEREVIGDRASRLKELKRQYQVFRKEMRLVEQSTFLQLVSQLVAFGTNPDNNDEVEFCLPAWVFDARSCYSLVASDRVYWRKSQLTKIVDNSLLGSVDSASADDTVFGLLPTAATPGSIKDPVMLHPGLYVS